MSGCHPTFECLCDCHKPWGSIIPPTCGCDCRKNINSTVNDRITKLENMSDYKKLEACIFEGAQTHLSILRCEAKYKELDKKLVDLEDSYSGLSHEMRYLEEKLTDKKDKKPHKCPVCEGKHYIYIPHHEIINVCTTQKQVACYTCEGTGVVWG